MAVRVAAPFAVVLAVGGVASLASAQGSANQGAPAASAASTTARAGLNIRQIYDRIEAAGYRDIVEIEWDDGRYEAKAHNAQGQRVKLYINATSGAVESTQQNR
ncbi:PepSY domain-containing protein [Diaphorobacter aerolatus]|uniref:PepSY domain-containing protein n=1 Tax=Diaphorobacter aerolatus TaxID=1288495 RepID=A0A7H0GIC6_9BURK|nr:PepSY domain-containing protein [Diaphorobacter aerolatus]QNP48042.1 PepSY domain-containing protein [Diaphorobacter aerolatus]